MVIETVDDLCESIADMIGVYGACKSEEQNGCSNEDPKCCRVGFCMVMKERIYNAVENTQKIDSAGL